MGLNCTLSSANYMHSSRHLGDLSVATLDLKKKKKVKQSGLNYKTTFEMMPSTHRKSGKVEQSVFHRSRERGSGLFPNKRL